MALESRETSNGFALEAERGHAVRHALLCVRDDLDDRVAQLGKRCSLGLTKRGEVLVDFIVGHTGTFKVATRAVKLAQTAIPTDLTSSRTSPVWTLARYRSASVPTATTRQPSV
jgi:hypothetical protein